MMQRLRQVFGIDLRTLALFRVGAALLILVDLFLRAGDLTAHYSDSGWLPRSVVAELFSDRGPLSLHMASGMPWLQAGLFLAAAVFAVQLLVGYRTRLATVVSWLLLVSLHLRNPLVLSGADTLLAVLMFWAMFLPLGARCSVDAALDPDNDRHPDQHFSVASVAMLVQVMSVYFFTALLKSGPEWWPEGTAVYYALHIDMYVTPLGTLIRDWPVLLNWLTWLVLVLEYVCPVLIFLPLFNTPLRLLCLALLGGMHIGFELFLELGLFPHTSLLSLSLFIPAAVWDRLGERGSRRREALRIWYDPDCEYCRRISLVIAQLLVLPASLIVRPASDNGAALTRLRETHSWVVEDGAGGSAYTGFAAFLALLRASPLWWWLAPLLALAPLQAVGESAYRRAAAHRAALAAALMPRMPVRPMRLHNPWQVNLLVAVLAMLVFVWNWQGIPQTEWETPPVVESILDLLRIKQRWAMFAPWPSKDEGWYVMPGELENGTPVDVYHARHGEPDYSKPAYLSRTFHSYRWRKFLNNLRGKRGERFRLHYARYLCREWNEHAAPGQRLRDFRIIFYKETTLPDYASPRVEPVVLWVHGCLATEQEMQEQHLRKKIQSIGED